ICNDKVRTVGRKTGLGAAHIDFPGIVRSELEFAGLEVRGNGPGITSLSTLEGHVGVSVPTAWSSLANDSPVDFDCFVGQRLAIHTQTIESIFFNSQIIGTIRASEHARRG